MAISGVITPFITGRGPPCSILKIPPFGLRFSTVRRGSVTGFCPSTVSILCRTGYWWWFVISDGLFMVVWLVIGSISWVVITWVFDDVLIVRFPNHTYTIVHHTSTPLYCGRNPTNQLNMWIYTSQIVGFQWMRLDFNGGNLYIPFIHPR